MAKLYPKQTRAGNIRYYAIFYDPSKEPKQKWVNLRTDQERTAIQRLAKMEREYAILGSDGRPMFDPWEDKGLIMEAAPGKITAAWEAHLEELDLSPDTKAFLRSTIGLFMTSLGETALVAVKPRHVDAFLSQRKASTQQTMLPRFNRFFDWCVAERYVRQSPMPKVRRVKVKKKTPRFLMPEEWRRVEAIIEREIQQSRGDRRRATLSHMTLRDMSVIALFTGMRSGEIRHLRWVDVDLEGGSVRVHSSDFHETKSRKSREVPLLTEARAAFDRRQEHRRSMPPSPLDLVFPSPTNRTKPFSRSMTTYWWAHYRKEAGLDDRATFHALRHTFASWAVQRGMPLIDLMKVMGHENIQTTMIYAHVLPETAAAAMRRAFGEAEKDRAQYMFNKPSPETRENGEISGGRASLLARNKLHNEYFC